MAEFVLTEIAEQDVDSIHSYIFLESPTAADSVLDALFKSLHLLAQHPQIGALKKLGVNNQIRSWVLTEYPSYIIYYQEVAQSGSIEIIRVLHGARDLSSLFKE